ncbi:protein disulfide oxidoreductase [Vibrio inusitatus NBRC 102082]|uniref:Protein disulfide oxidoreductase n=1 Tax=Vibrio inusitatus NBRC 102082 TaxID=1219070 RepID=A0A4Y3HUP6_9VIBR|nr:protein disulfide oxidoreductase [Vibrio inusitatus]GEA50014.1 protein disulfide oxidoreductase [Vibrio inusitatus NBRC 102082]
MKTILNIFKKSLLYILIFTVISVAVDLWRTRDFTSSESPTTHAMTISGNLIDLNTVSQDKPVVVYFWATWCGACKFVTPTINWLSQYYNVVAISASSGEARRVQAYLDSHDYQFENINDPKSQISSRWNLKVTPTIAIVENGQIKNITTGITTPIGLLARLWLL